MQPYMRNSIAFRFMHERQRNLYELLPVSSLPALMLKKKKRKLNVIALTLFYRNIFSFPPIDLRLLTFLALVKTSCMLPKHRNRNQRCLVLTAIALRS